MGALKGIDVQLSLRSRHGFKKHSTAARMLLQKVARVNEE